MNYRHEIDQWHYSIGGPCDLGFKRSDCCINVSPQVAEDMLSGAPGFNRSCAGSIFFWNGFFISVVDESGEYLKMSAGAGSILVKIT